MTNKKVSLLDFRQSVARTYVAKSSTSDPRNAGRPSLPMRFMRRVEEAVRLDPIGHILEWTNEGKQRNVLFVRKMQESNVQSAM